MLPMLSILLGVGVLTRLIQLFENTTVAYQIVFVSSLVALIITSVVCLVMSVVVSVARFRSNLFTAEGYLSFALPVTPMEHIIAKTVSAFATVVTALLGIAVALAVAGAGDMTEEVVKAAAYLLSYYIKRVGLANGVLYCIELAVLIATATVTRLMLFFACIALGQRAKKNRLLAAFGIYFAYYFIMQILGTVCIIVFSSLTYHTPEFIIRAIEWAERNPWSTVHIVLCGAVILTALLGCVYTAITHNSMKKHLNLE